MKTRTTCGRNPAYNNGLLFSIKTSWRSLSPTVNRNRLVMATSNGRTCESLLRRQRRSAQCHRTGSSGNGHDAARPLPPRTRSQGHVRRTRAEWRATVLAPVAPLGAAAPGAAQSRVMRLEDVLITILREMLQGGSTTVPMPPSPSFAGYSPDLAGESLPPPRLRRVCNTLG